MKYRKTAWFSPFLFKSMVRFDVIEFGPNLSEEGVPCGLDVELTINNMPVTTKEALTDCNSEWTKLALAEMRRGMVESGITRTECPDMIPGHKFCFLCDDGEPE